MAMENSSLKEKELKELVEQQKVQISRYEKKLRDVIQAYKGVLKEKEALEASITALSELEVKDEQPYTTDLNATAVLSQEQSLSDDGEKTSQEYSEVLNSDDLVSKLKAQIQTLSNALSTITSEKSKSEAKFQQDRKRLLFDKEELEKSLAAACSQAESGAQSLKQQLSELKAHIILEKNERSKEEANNQVILRELQKTIAEERFKRETLERELNEKNSRLSQASNSASMLEISERKIRDLSNELEASKTKLRMTEQQLAQPSPHFQQLQKEMDDLKVQHRLAIQQEQRNAAEAKESARVLGAAHEKRVTSLEARLAELSLTVGSYDRLRQQDLATVSTLKEQLFAFQKQSNPSCPSVNLEEEEKDIHKLVERMVAMKERLEELSRPQCSININALLEKHGFGSKGDHESCQKEMQLLRQEMEWLKEEHNKEDGSNLKETCSDEVTNLRHQIQLLKKELVRHQEDHCRSLAAVQESWTKDRSSLKEEMLQTERSCRARIADLEQQSQKQRERSLTLLQEKDEELGSLRELLQMKNAAPSAATPPAPQEDSNAEAWPESLAPLASMTLGATASGGQILHYVEELARKEKEIQGLRRAKYQLETCLREMQMSTMALEQKTADQKRQLHEELARLERNQSREGENLEYLKNVVLEFFICSDASSQSHMFNAIAAILHFSSEEVKRVRMQHSKW